MIVRTVNTDDYLQCMIALSGLCPLSIRDEIEESSEYIRRRFKELEKSGRAESVSIEGMKSYLLGRNRDTLPAELVEHYIRQTNGGRKLNTEAMARRTSMKAQTIIFLHSMGIPIDGIAIKREVLGMDERAGERKKREPVFDDTKLERILLKRNASTYRQIARCADRDTINFFTAATVKTSKEEYEGMRTKANEATVRIAQSSLMGHLIGKGISYPVYMARSDSRQLLSHCERQTSEFLSFIAEDMYGRKHAIEIGRKYPRGQAVMLTESENELGEMIVNELDSRRDRIRPADVFSSCLVIPVSENGRAQMDIILRENAKERVLEELLEKSEIDSAAGERYRPDGVEEGSDGIQTYWYELVTMDICIIAMIRKLLTEMEAVLQNIEDYEGRELRKEERTLRLGLICLDWQQEMIQRLMEGFIKNFGHIECSIEYINISNDLIGRILERR